MKAMKLLLGAGMVAASAGSSAGILYSTSTDTSSTFYAMDTTTGIYTQKASVNTRSTLASDINGNVYALDINNSIVKYDAMINSWQYVMAGNSFGGSNYNLEVIGEDKFLVTQYNSSAYHLYNGSSWTTGSLSFAASMVAGYDVVNDMIGLTQISVDRTFFFDSDMNFIKVLGTGLGTGERKRDAAFYNGVYSYLFNTTLATTNFDLNTATTQSDPHWYGTSAVNIANGDRFYSTIGIGYNTPTTKVDSNGITTNFNTSNLSGYHSTSVVGGSAYNAEAEPPSEIPEPSLLAMMGFGLFGLFFAKFRKTKAET
ncbi:PEP-CTERM sorting domain-containing protein [Alteromonas lipolytica]|uniref:Ice-binding protein C-terminal domain-containing protein n=1 Tax=Alteromonas lipolytica TaxID=1856405 RepID=A0A1E8FD79_9ALTE|nr:PEP-CTERM sorting domain-containing protein [Alteromonas lipolytica]OFI33897.1 hypothetical protein BFC17_20240 [Alteromonas lipolytica]GGF67451.1 hypothetical protein GCM10011338_19510 [Alteromonas lipolytica]